MNNKQFKLDRAKYVLLTYAQCGGLDPWEVMEHISGMGAECIIGRELHADEGIHLHCFVDFGREYSTRKTDAFDVAGQHPNIERVGKTPHKAYDYAIKDGDVVCGGAERPSESGGRDRKSHATWTRIANARSRDEFWELCRELDPKSMCTNFSTLQRFADWQYREHIPEYTSPSGISFYGGGLDGRDDWLSQSGIGSGAMEPMSGMFVF